MFYGDLAGYGAPYLKIDEHDYALPISSILGDEYCVIRFHMGVNPHTSKRSLRVEWYADGKVYESYFDVDFSDI